MTLSPPFVAAVTGAPRWLEALPYQVVGLCVVFTVVGLVWLLMESLGLIVRWCGKHQEAPPPPVDALSPPPSPPPAIPPPAPPPAHAGVSPEVIVVITAAVNTWIDARMNIVSIVPSDRTHEQNPQPLAWSNEGRRQHFASHKVR